MSKLQKRETNPKENLFRRKEPQLGTKQVEITLNNTPSGRIFRLQTPIEFTHQLRTRSASRSNVIQPSTRKPTAIGQEHKLAEPFAKPTTVRILPNSVNSYHQPLSLSIFRNNLNLSLIVIIASCCSFLCPFEYSRNTREFGRLRKNFLCVF